jgi:hypothetical protein
MSGSTPTTCDLCRGLQEVLGRADGERVSINGWIDTDGQQSWTVDVVTHAAAGHACGELTASLCAAIRQVNQP